MNIAVCLSGGLRNTEKCLQSIEHISQAGNVKIFVHSWVFANEQNKIAPEQRTYPNNNFNFLFEDARVVTTTIEQYEHKLDFLYKTKEKSQVKLEAWPNKIVHFSMWYSVMQSNALKIKYEKDHSCLFDVVYRMRFDSLITNPEHLLKSRLDDNTIVIPQVEKDYAGTNDQFAYGSSNGMDKYASLFNNLNNITGVYDNPETILKAHLATQDVKIQRDLNLKVEIYH